MRTPETGKMMHQRAPLLRWLLPVAIAALLCLCAGNGFAATGGRCTTDPSFNPNLATMPQASIVSTILRNIKLDLLGSAQTIFNSIVLDADFQIVVKAATAIYIAIYGALFMLGMLKTATISDFAIRIVKIGFVGALLSANAWTFFGGSADGSFESAQPSLNAAYFFNEGLDDVIQNVNVLMWNQFHSQPGVNDISSNGLDWSTLGQDSGATEMSNLDDDTTFFIFDKPLATIASSKMAVTLMAMFTTLPYGPILAILTLFSLGSFFKAILTGVWIYLMSMVLRALLLGVAPLFIICLFFERLRHLFSGWLSQLLNAVLQPAFYFLYYTFFLDLLMVYINYVLSVPVCGTAPKSAAGVNNADQMEVWRFKLNGAVFDSTGLGDNASTFPLNPINILILFVLVRITSQFSSAVISISMDLAGASTRLDSMQGAMSDWFGSMKGLVTTVIAGGAVMGAGAVAGGAMGGTITGGSNEGTAPSKARGGAGGGVAVPVAEGAAAAPAANGRSRRLNVVMPPPLPDSDERGVPATRGRAAATTGMRPGGSDESRAVPVPVGAGHASGSGRARPGLNAGIIGAAALVSSRNRPDGSAKSRSNSRRQDAAAKENHAAAQAARAAAVNRIDALNRAASSDINRTINDKNLSQDAIARQTALIRVETKAQAFAVREAYRKEPKILPEEVKAIETAAGAKAREDYLSREKAITGQAATAIARNEKRSADALKKLEGTASAGVLAERKAALKQREQQATRSIEKQRDAKIKEMAGKLATEDYSQLKAQSDAALKRANLAASERASAASRQGDAAAQAANAQLAKDLQANEAQARANFEKALALMGRKAQQSAGRSAGLRRAIARLINSGAQRAAPVREAATTLRPEIRVTEKPATQPIVPGQVSAAAAAPQPTRLRETPAERTARAEAQQARRAAAALAAGDISAVTEAAKPKIRALLDAGNARDAALLKAETGARVAAIREAYRQDPAVSRAKLDELQNNAARKAHDDYASREQIIDAQAKAALGRGRDASAVKRIKKQELHNMGKLLESDAYWQVKAQSEANLTKARADITARAGEATQLAENLRAAEIQAASVLNNAVARLGRTGKRPGGLRAAMNALAASATTLVARIPATVEAATPATAGARATPASGAAAAKAAVKETPEQKAARVEARRVRLAAATAASQDIAGIAEASKKTINSYLARGDAHGADVAKAERAAQIAAVRQAYLQEPAITKEKLEAVKEAAASGAREEYQGRFKAISDQAAAAIARNPAAARRIKKQRDKIIMALGKELADEKYHQRKGLERGLAPAARPAEPVAAHEDTAAPLAASAPAVPPVTPAAPSVAPAPPVVAATPAAVPPASGGTAGPGLIGTAGAVASAGLVMAKVKLEGGTPDAPASPPRHAAPGSAAHAADSATHRPAAGGSHDTKSRLDAANKAASAAKKLAEGDVVGSAFDGADLANDTLGKGTRLAAKIGGAIQVGSAAYDVYKKTQEAYDETYKKELAKTGDEAKAVKAAKAAAMERAARETVKAGVSAALAASTGGVANTIGGDAIGLSVERQFERSKELHDIAMNAYAMATGATKADMSALAKEGGKIIENEMKATVEQIKALPAYNIKRGIDEILEWRKDALLEAEIGERFATKVTASAGPVTKPPKAGNFLDKALGDKALAELSKAGGYTFRDGRTVKLESEERADSTQDMAAIERNAKLVAEVKGDLNLDTLQKELTTARKRDETRREINADQSNGWQRNAPSFLGGMDQKDINRQAAQENKLRDNIKIADSTLQELAAYKADLAKYNAGKALAGKEKPPVAVAAAPAAPLAASAPAVPPVTPAAPSVAPAPPVVAATPAAVPPAGGSAIPASGAAAAKAAVKETPEQKAARLAAAAAASQDIAGIAEASKKTINSYLARGDAHGADVAKAERAAQIAAVRQAYLQEPAITKEKLEAVKEAAASGAREEYQGRFKAISDQAAEAIAHGGKADGTSDPLAVRRIERQREEQIHKMGRQLAREEHYHTEITPAAGLAMAPAASTVVPDNAPVAGPQSGVAQPAAPAIAASGKNQLANNHTAAHGEKKIYDDVAAAASMAKRNQEQARKIEDDDDPEYTGPKKKRRKKG